MDPLIGLKRSWTTYYNKQAEAAWRSLGRVPKDLKHGGTPNWNRFAHTYVAAMVRLGWPSFIARYMGESRESGTWVGGDKPYYKTLGDRRDTFADLYNNAIGIKAMEYLLYNNKDLSTLPRVIADLVDRGVTINDPASDPRILRSVTDKKPNLSSAQADLRAIENGAWSAAQGTNVTPGIPVPNAQVDPATQGFLMQISYDPNSGIGFGDNSGASSPDSDAYLNQDSAAVEQQGAAFLQAANFIIQSNRANEFGNLGNIVGSSLGRLIGGGPVVDTAASAFLGTVMQNFAQGIAIGGFNKPIINQSGAIVDGLLDDFGQEFLANLKSAAIGTVSSLISLEIGNALGVGGFGGELLGAANASIIGQVVSNVANGQSLFAGLSADGLFKGIDGVTPEGGILPGAIGSFLGAKLGSLILAPINTEGAVLSSIGASAGVWALTSGASSLGIGSFAASIGKVFGSLANVGVPFVGSLVGFLLGSLIGRLFGRKKPRIPTASAESYLDLSSASWLVGSITSANGGNRALVSDMARSASDGINQIVAIAAGGSGTVMLANASSPHQKYGHTGSTVYFDDQVGGSWVRRYSGDKADRAVEAGVIAGTRATLVAGGDLILKRAIYGTPATDIATMMGNIATAKDVQVYLGNTEAINKLINYQPNDPFSLTWMSTLLRADELNLLRYQASDFYGGLRGFLDSFGFGSTVADASKSFENISVNFEGAALRIATQDGSGPFKLLAGTNNVADPAMANRSVYIENFAAAVGYTAWTGQATAGNDIWIASAGGPVTMDDLGYEERWQWNPYDYTYEPYYVEVSGGDDIFVGSDYGDTLYGRSGWDWLDGGAGDDLADGGDGNDVLLGRGGNDRMLGGAGNDYLAGGEGDDYFYDSSRTWGLYGGDGNDVLVGGGGTDSSYGENGDDLFIVDQDGGGTWDAITGQAGSDTISYERFTSGVYVDFANLGGWSWDPTAKYIYGDAISGVENVTGSRFGDTLLGDAGANVLTGLEGDDHLLGRDGDDVLEGGAGQDTLDGGNGFDIVSFRSSKVGVLVDLASGASSDDGPVDDTLVSIEGAEGSDLDDLIIGSAGDNRLAGRAGDDVFAFSAGSDFIDGGLGSDQIDFSDSTTGGLTLYYDGGYYDPDYGYTPGAGWIASVAGSGTTTFSSIEGFVGTDFADYMSGDVADETYQGGAGNDTIYGGAGSDTYIFNRGDGQDNVGETSDGNNTILLGEGVNWRDVGIYGANYSQNGGNLVVSIRDTGDQVVVGGNFSYVNSGSNAGNHNHAIKSVNVGGGSVVDIDMIDWTPYAADEGSTVVYGAQNRADLIFAYGGDDTIYVAGSSGSYETRGNVVYAGDGNDTVFGSAGDDQYIFERGNGVDTLTELGGDDTIIMGPSVTADDVIYEVVNTYGSSGDYGSSADLYIGLRDPGNPNAPASQVADRIRIVGGGTKSVGVNSGAELLNTIEHVRVGGQEIDLTKANINWTVSYYYDGYYYPIAIDLDGDGIELRSVEGSRIASVESDGTVTRMGWLGQDDGFLALDRDGNGVIDRIGEISFVGDKVGAKTDLEGLAAYDSNSDGKLDASDARWGEFKVWQDKNQDGFGSKNELVTLDKAGIASISLKGQLTGFTAADGPDNTVIATTGIAWTDSSRTGSAYDVALARLQVRTDDAGKDLADLDSKGRGKKADDIEAKLRGIQGLTAEQAAAIKEKKSKQTDDGEGGRLYRVEELLEGGSAKVKDGLFSIDPKLAKKAVEAGRKLALLDRYAESEWTKLGSTESGKADMRGADAPFKMVELSDEQKAVIASARKIVTDRKASDEAKAAARAAKDAADAVLRPAPTPPTAEEMQKLKKNDKFQLLTGATDASADVEEQIDPRLLQQDPTGNSAQMRVLDDGTFVPAEEEEAQPPASDQVSAPQRLSGVEPTPQDADRGDQNAEAEVYSVVIRAANARLVQALASLGDAPAMMATYQGLNVANDPQAAWLSVDAMPSVQRLAAIR